MTVIVARFALMLVLLIVALVWTVRLYRRTCRADMILILLMFWFGHAIVYYVVGLFFAITLDPYPRELALVVNWWSTVLRFQILLALLAILRWHPERTHG